MEYRTLGDSDLRVSLVGLGCNNFGGEGHSSAVAAYGALDLDATRAVVDAALDAGVTLFDTADVYGHGGSERFLGTLLHSRRDQVVIATKWGSGLPEGTAWGRREFVRGAVEASLRRLRTDRIDLYQMHWPDPLTPIGETLDALDELVAEGTIRQHGSSHFTGAEITAADAWSRSRGQRPMVSAQNHYNLLHRDAEADVLPACAATGVGLLPYFPLASGLLTGKYRAAGATGRLAGKPVDAATLAELDRLEDFARARSHSLLELAVAGLAARPEVASVITGATSPAQIRSNAAAADWVLGADDRAALFTEVAA